MEQVFFRLHVRLIRFVSPVLTPRIRVLLEKFVLLNSVLSLCLLIWLHTSYVNYPQSSQSNCLYQELVSKNMTGNVADYDVIKVHISNDWLRQLNHDTYHSDRSSVCYATNKYDVSPTDTDSRGITEASPTSEKLPILFDSFISSMGMHIHDSQHSTPRYESSGRGGGSARLFSVAERLLSSPGPAATSHMDIPAEQSGEYSGAEIDMIGEVDTTMNPNMDSVAPEAMPGSEVTPSALPTEMANILKNFFVSQRVYLFSLEKGYLMLHPDERDRHDIRRLDLTIARDSKCFGPASSAWLVHSFIGYDTVVMNWAISTFGGRGYLYNIYSKELFNLNFASDLLEKTGAAPVPDIVKPNEGSDVEVEVEDSILWWMYRRLEQLTQRTRGGKLVQFSFVGARHFIAFKVGVIFSTLFLFFTTTTLVSFTLRETQERMLKFTFLLQHHVSHRIPYAPLVFTHVVESLVFVPIMVRINVHPMPPSHIPSLFLVAPLLINCLCISLILFLLEFDCVVGAHHITQHTYS
jgi:Tumour-associated protein